MYNLRTKLIEAGDALSTYGNDIQRQFLDYFGLGIKYYAMRDFDNAFMALEEALKVYKNIDNIKTFKNDPSFSAVFTLFSDVENLQAKEKFTGKELVGLISQFKIQVSRMADTSVQTEETADGSHIVIIDEEITNGHQAEEILSPIDDLDLDEVEQKDIPAEKPVKQKGKARQPQIKEIGARLVRDLSIAIHDELAGQKDGSKGLEDQLDDIKNFSGSNSERKNMIKKFKENINKLLNHHGQLFTQFRETFEGAKVNEEPELDLKLLNPILIDRVYNVLRPDYKVENQPNTIRINKHNYYLSGSAKNTFLELLFKYLSAYYYAEIKRIIYTRTNGSYKTLPKKDRNELLGYIFGSEETDFDPDNEFVFYDQNWQYLNQNVLRSKYLVSLFGHKSIRQCIGKENAVKLCTMSDNLLKVDTKNIDEAGQNKLMAALISGFLTIGISAGSVYFLNNSKQSKSGDSTETENIVDADTIVVKVKPKDGKKGTVSPENTTKIIVTPPRKKTQEEIEAEKEQQRLFREKQEEDRKKREEERKQREEDEKRRKEEEKKRKENSGPDGI